MQKIYIPGSDKKILPIEIIIPVDPYKFIMARVSLKSAILSVGLFSLMVILYRWGSCDIGHRDDNFYR
jgi:hypothetical protein